MTNSDFSVVGTYYTFEICICMQLYIKYIASVKRWQYHPLRKLQFRGVCMHSAHFSVHAGVFEWYMYIYNYCTQHITIRVLYSTYMYEIYSR